MVDQSHPLTLALVRILSDEIDIDRDEYDPASVRDLLRKAYAGKPEELRRLCYYEPCLKPIINDLSEQYDLEDVVDAAIDYCMRKRMIAELLRLVQTENPNQYARSYPYESWMRTLHNNAAKYCDLAASQQVPNETTLPALGLSYVQQNDLYESLVPHPYSRARFALIVGAGVLIDNNKIATSAHAVTRACALRGFPTDPQPKVLIDFPYLTTTRPLRAMCVFQSEGRQLPPYSGQVVHLTFDENISGATPMPLGSCKGTAAKAFGFTSRHLRGGEVGVEVLPRTEEYAQVESGSGTKALGLPGFSGAPVWDEQFQRVVGIVVSKVDDRKATGDPPSLPHKDVAYMLTCRLIHDPLSEKCGGSTRMPSSIDQSPSGSNTTGQKVTSFSGSTPTHLDAVEIPDTTWQAFLNVAGATSILIEHSASILQELQTQIVQAIHSSQSRQRLDNWDSLERLFDRFDNEVAPRGSDKEVVKKLTEFVRVIRLAITRYHQAIETYYNAPTDSSVGG